MVMRYGVKTSRWSSHFLGKMHVFSTSFRNRPTRLTQCYPIQSLWEYNVLFQEFPYHLNENATLKCKYNTQRILRSGSIITGAFSCDKFSVIIFSFLTRWLQNFAKNNRYHLAIIQSIPISLVVNFS